MRFDVLAAQFLGTSPWDNDLTNFSGNITRIATQKSYLPYHLRTLPVGLAEKIRWKTSLWFWPIRSKQIRENYYDVSAGNELVFYKAAEELIARKKHNIVLLSVGPFSYSSILPHLKKRFPEVKFVIDYRDFWEDEFPALTERQISREREKQRSVLEAIDLVLSPNEEMQAFYGALSGRRSVCLPHCFDSDDMTGIPPDPDNNNFVSLVYGGALYPEIAGEIALIRKFLDKLALLRPVKADFYLSIKGYETELEHASIQRHNSISAKEYFSRVSVSDCVILILPANRVNAMSSKFYELVAGRKPILYFGGDGTVARYILDNKLGWHLTASNLSEIANRVVENISTGNIPDRNYNIESHSFVSATRQLITMLEELIIS